MSANVLPLDPTAPKDSVDGWIVEHGFDRGLDDVAWLKFWRSQAAKSLRRLPPTGVVVPSGSRAREAVVATLLARSTFQERPGFIPCGVCGVLVTGVIADVDHIVPLIRGGRHHIDNLQLAHTPCNQFKRTSTYVDPAAARAELLAWTQRKGYGDGTWIVQQIRRHERSAA